MCSILNTDDCDPSGAACQQLYIVKKLDLDCFEEE